MTKYVKPTALASLLFFFFICAIYGSSSTMPILSNRAIYGVCINELMGSNETIIADNDGDYEDWVELWNHGEEAVSLEGWGLSDKASEPFRWVFPAVVLQPDQFMLVWCSKKDRAVAGAPLHTNFGISSSGEELFLTHPSGTLADMAPAIASQTDISVGRFPDGTGPWFFFDQPTPLAPNTSPYYTEILAPPVFSMPGGFYSEGFDLLLTHPDPEVTVVYSLDGSEPDLGNLNGTVYQYKNSYRASPSNPEAPMLENSYQSHLYQAPLLIHDRSPEADKMSQMSSTYDYIPAYFPSNPVTKGMVVRAKAFKPNALASETITNTYFVFAEGRGRYQLPVVSFSVQEDLFFDYQNGIYTAGVDFDTWRASNPNSTAIGSIGNWTRSGEEWEYPAHFELFETESNNAALSQRVGFRLHGGWSTLYSRKSLRLYARDIYGTSSFEHNIFKDQPYNSYKRIILRNSGNDYHRTQLKDATIQEICKNLHFDTQASQPSVLFVNGEYWGIHNIRERYDKHYLARVYGVDSENLDLLETYWDINEGDRVHFNAMMTYIRSHNLSNPAYFEHVSTLMDIENFMDYQIAEIFIRNHDWPGNNIKYWRLRTDSYQPNAPYGHDGRWRWLMYDTDGAFLNSTESADNTLIWATTHKSAHSTVILNGLLKNQGFKTAFINRFADLMNSHFIPAHMIEIIRKNKAVIAPEIPEQIVRWKVPTTQAQWNSFINWMIAFANNRPAHQRQHLRDFFDIPGDILVTLDVNDNEQGLVRINTIDICGETPGINEAPYPWGGIYFQGIPIEVEAKALPGYVFSHWEGDAEGTEPILTLTPDGDLYLKAVFTQSGLSDAEIIHYWHFNSLPDGTLIAVASDYSARGTATITYPGTGDGYMDRRTHRAADPVSNLNLLMGQEPNQGAVLRLRNPSDTRELIVEAPSTGFQTISGAYATSRTSNGATQQELYYSTNGGASWTQIGSTYSLPELPDWILRTFDISSDEAANNNENLMFRILFTGENTDNASGNDRLDNFSLHGIPLPEVNLPPLVIEIPALQKAIEEGDALQIELGNLFQDPENDFLSFTVSSSRPDFVQTQLFGDVLNLTPLRRGDALITITANDGFNEDVNLEFKVLVYPKAYSFSASGFSFDAWDAGIPELVYPEHMLFLQSDVDDPGLAQPLEHAYHIEHDDYHASDSGSIGYPYQLTGRSRLNGLGDDGISFINTGRGRDLGGALLALNTVGEEELELSWLGGTLLRNNRVYAIRLQYRIGIEGDFSDFLMDGSPVEYLAANDGHSQIFSNLPLPAELMGQEYLQLLWKYYHVSGGSGSRAQLRLDEISILRPDAGLPPVEELRISHVPESEGILLEWSHPGTVSRFLIYSSDMPYFSPDAENFLTAVDYPQTQYLDPEPQNRRFYIVIAERDANAAAGTGRRQIHKNTK